MERTELEQLKRGDVIYFYDAEYYNWQPSMITDKGLNYLQMVALQGSIIGQIWKAPIDKDFYDNYSVYDPTPPPKKKWWQIFKTF